MHAVHSPYLGIDGDTALDLWLLVGRVMRRADAVRIDGRLLADAHGLGQERIDVCCCGGKEGDKDTSGRAHVLVLPLSLSPALPRVSNLVLNLFACCRSMSSRRPP